jgi:hypothetical protein
VFATPVGYLIDEKGLLATSVGMGAEAILNLTSIRGSRATHGQTLSAAREIS